MLIEGIGCGSTMPFIGDVDWTLSFEERGDWELELDKPFDWSNDDGIVLSKDLVGGTEADVTNRRDISKVWNMCCLYDEVFILIRVKIL